MLGSPDTNDDDTFRRRITRAWNEISERGIDFKYRLFPGMTRSRALDLLRGKRKGIDRWNRWRESNNDEIALEFADLHGARLILADLQGVIFNWANLSMTVLCGANLSETGLSAANLHGAVLRDANLSRAVLRGTNLSDADLREADFTGATCDRTVFARVDLSQVKGLDLVRHDGPSSVGIDTLLLSKGKIPEVFLRGCGLPEYLIENQTAIVGSLEPIQFYSCFISYSTRDEDFAHRLHSKMRDEGLRVWFDREDMKGGRTVIDQIERAIQLQDKLLLVLSDASIQSHWVQTELGTAFARQGKENRQILFPIRITAWEAVQTWKCFDSDTGQDLAKVVRAYHIPDFSNWKDHDSFEASFARLLRDLKAEESSIPKPT